MKIDFIDNNRIHKFIVGKYSNPVMIDWTIEDSNNRIWENLRLK